MTYRNPAFNVGVAAFAILLLTACAAPGQPREAAVAETQTAAEPEVISLAPTSGEVVLEMRVNSDLLPLWEALADAFSDEHPNIGVEIIDEDFSSLLQNGPRYLTSDDPPDLLRLPSLGTLVADDLLLNLDPYADHYDWHDFPDSQLDQFRVQEDGVTRGAGSLYALGIGYAMVGMYYNLDKAAALGMVAAPADLDELESLFDAALAVGELPLIAAGDNSYLFQGLAQTLGAAEAINDWVWQADDADLSVPEAIEAAGLLADWVDAGYLPQDVLGIDDTTALSSFTSGTGVFLFQGSWNAVALDDSMVGNVGFFPLPPAEAGGRTFATSAGASFGIPASADHPDEAAAFLDWANGEEAAALVRDLGGLIPGGRAGAVQAPTNEASVQAQTIEAFQAVGEADGFVNFLADATPGIQANALAPQMQLLLSRRVTPEDFIAEIQAAYESEIR